MAIEGVAPLTVLAAAVPSTVATPLSATDIERFQSAMAAGPPSGAAPVNAAPAHAADNVSVANAALAANVPGLAADAQAVARTGTLGDTILSTLESSSTRVRNAWAEAGEALKQPDLRMTDMLNLQVKVLEASIQTELISKGINKANQSLDQMLRTQ